MSLFTSSFRSLLDFSLKRCFLGCSVGGLLVLLAACSSGIQRDLPEITTQAAQTLRIPVSSSADDAEGGSSVVSSGMALDFAENRQTVGLRFAGVRIPPGARINWAIISFTASAADAYVYLAESIQAWPDQAALAARLAAAGWVDVEWRDLTGGVVALHRGRART